MQTLQSQLCLVWLLMQMPLSLTANVARCIQTPKPCNHSNHAGPMEENCEVSLLGVGASVYACLSISGIAPLPRSCWGYPCILFIKGQPGSTLWFCDLAFKRDLVKRWSLSISSTSDLRPDLQPYKAVASKGCACRRVTQCYPWMWWWSEESLDDPKDSENLRFGASFRAWGRGDTFSLGGSPWLSTLHSHTALSAS